MPAATYYLEIEFELTSFGTDNPGPTFWNVNDSLNAQMGAGGINMTSIPPGWQGTWYDVGMPAGLALNVPHVFKQAHTPLAESTKIDGFTVQFNPGLGIGYVAAMAGRQAQHFQLGLYHPAVVVPDTAAFFDRVKIGSAPGLADYLDWTAATDGMGPFTVIAGAAAINGGRLEFPSPIGGQVEFDFVAPWPPVFTFHCSFSVGVTKNARSSAPLPPPDDIVLVQGALPETLLSEGYRIEVGTYTPAGVPRATDSIRDATVAFVTPQEPEDES
jgi:hypothetical protein